MNSTNLNHIFNTKITNNYNTSNLLTTSFIVHNLSLIPKPTYNTKNNLNLLILNYDSLFYSYVKLNFKYLTLNLFQSFFTSSKVEIPKPLLKLKTLKSNKNQILIYKFNNFITLHGKFINSIINLNTA